MSKPSTPVRRSKVGPGRPASAGDEIPLVASMEVLPPDPCAPPLLAAMEVGRSQDLTGSATGAKPRTPGTAPLTRTRSTDGRRSILQSSGPYSQSHQPHEVISLTSTTAKSLSSSNHILLPCNQQLPPPASPYASSVGLGPQQLQVSSSQQWQGQTQGLVGDVGSSHASLLRFNPVSEGDDDASGQAAVQRPQSQPQAQAQQGQGEAAGRESSSARGSRVVVVGGSAAAVAQRAAAAAAAAGNGASGRRYAAAAESVAGPFSHEQQQGQEPQQGGAARGPSRGGAGRGEGDAGGVPGLLRQSVTASESELPGTPGSVASGVSGMAGGTFFTDLHRSFGDGSRLRLRVSSDPRVTQSQDLTPGFSQSQGLMSSRHNPMQSPSMSEDGGEQDDNAFAEYAGEEDGPLLGRITPPPGAESAEALAAAGDQPEEGDPLPQESTLALTEYSNPLQTPQDSRLATPLLPSATAGTASVAASSSSLLHVIHDLYVTEPDPQPVAAAADEPSPSAAAAARSSRPAPDMPAEPAATAAAGGGAEGAGGDGTANNDDTADGTAVLAASRAAVAALAARVDSQQSQRRSELGEYMAALQDLKDDSGSKLVELPPDWGVMLERLFRQRRAEYAALEGWMGPRRFDDLPINQLPSDHHPDPRVEEGLARIRELDAVLNDKLIEALISHRETFPDQWAEQERKRLERHTKGVEEALKRERQKRLRAARISRAVTSLEGGPAISDVGRTSHGSMRSLAEQPSSVYSRLFTLKPEEEALVEAVMQRNDDEGAAINPFDLESAAVYGNTAPTSTSAAPPAPAPPSSASGRPASVISTSTAIGGGGRGGVTITVGDNTNPDDIEVEIEQLLPSTSMGSCCATPSTPSVAAAFGAAAFRASTAGLRPLSARAADRSDREGEASRPMSAASTTSFSASRPGTSSGATGGMSALAAAALHGHPALLAVAALRTSEGATAAGGIGIGGSGLLPNRVYEDPKVAARALRAINARLAAFESEHLWDESGVLADFKSISSRQPGGLAAQSSLSLGSPASATAPPRPASPPGSVRSGAGCGGGAGAPVAAPASVSGVSVTGTGHRDYLREERLAKELASRERDIDAALRNLKTGEVVRLGEATLKALVEQCKKLQELNEHRRKIEEAEAAARKAQQQRQQLLAAASANGRGGSASPRTPNGGATPQQGAATASTSAAKSSTSPGAVRGANANGGGVASLNAATAAGSSSSGGTANNRGGSAKGLPPQPGRQQGASAAAPAAEGSSGAGSRGGTSATGGAGSGAAAAGGQTGGRAEGSQRHNSAGSNSSRPNPTPAADKGQGAEGTAPAPSRRASDPAMPSPTGGSTNNTGSGAGGGGAGKAARAGGGSGIAGACPTSTPPKPKASAANKAVVTSSAVGGLGAAAGAGSSVGSLPADTGGGLPPPPPPPPP